MLVYSVCFIVFELKISKIQGKGMRGLLSSLALMIRVMMNAKAGFDILF